MEPQGLPGAEVDYEMLGLLVPSPQSEAVTHELEELTLQPSNNLPPLNERKNGEWGWNRLGELLTLHSCCSCSSTGLAMALMNEHMITGLNGA
uniref:Uncharacterized protein n=1 Tax=Hucho hucho TaxID=62062 RepID=A0A4W5NN93_9TELE